MGTKKGMKRKTARRAYEPRRYAKISKSSMGGEEALQITRPGKVFGRVFVPNKSFFNSFRRVK
jgi:hypothetical protein